MKIKNLYYDKDKYQFLIHTTEDKLNILKMKPSFYLVEEGLQYLKSFLKEKNINIGVKKTNFTGLNGESIYEVFLKDDKHDYYAFREFKNEFVRYLAGLKKRKLIVGNFIKDVGLFTVEDIQFDRTYWMLDIEVYSTPEALKHGWNKPQQAMMPITSITWYNNTDNTYYTIINTEFIKVNNPKDVIEYEREYHQQYNIKTKITIAKDEVDLLDKFLIYVKIQKPSIITGWFSNMYDIPYLVKRLIQHGLFNDFLSFDSNEYKISKPYFKEFAQGGRGVVYYINVPMIYFIDYKELYEKFIPETPTSWGLDNIAKINGLEFGKTEKMGYLHIDDYKRFLSYIIRDVEILVKLEEKLKLITLLNSFNEIVPINLDKLMSTLYTVEGYLNLFAWKENVLLPFTSGVKNIDPEENNDESYTGAYVHTPDDGVHKNVVVLDFASLYPNIILTCSIDIQPVKKPTEPVKYTHINKELTGVRDVYFLQKDTLIRKMIRNILEMRFYYKKLSKEHPDNMEYYNRQLNYKILANSIYGVFGTKYFTFYNTDVALSITSVGRYLIRSVIDYVDDKTWREDINGFKYTFLTKVVYGDTDSVFIEFIFINPVIMDNEEVTLVCAERIREHVNNKIPDFLKEIIQNISDEELRQINTLRMEIDKVFKRVKFFGVKKRYYGFDYHGKEIYKGVDLARSDFPQFLKNKLRQLFMLLVTNDNISEKDMKDLFVQIYNELETTHLEEIAESKTLTTLEYKVDPYHLRGWKLFKYIAEDVMDIDYDDNELIGQKIYVIPVKILNTSKYFNVAREIFNEKRKKVTEISGYLSFKENDTKIVKEILTNDKTIKVDYLSIYEQFVRRFESFMSEKIINDILSTVTTNNNVQQLYTLFGGII